MVREGVLASFFGGEEVTEEERAAVSSLKDKLVSVPARTYAWMTDVDLLRYVRQSRGRVRPLPTTQFPFSIAGRDGYACVTGLR